MKLKAQKREIAGKKVKNLRKSGLIPASIFGPNIETVNIVVNPSEFRKIFAKVEYNKLFDLELEGAEKSVKVLVKEIQLDPVKDDMYHIGFYQIDMAKKIHVDVPITFIGESMAVKNNLGFMVTIFESLPVHCLPGNIPSDITVDLSKLENVNDGVHVGDLTLPEGVEWGSEISVESVIARVAPPQKEVVEEVAVVEAVEGEDAAAATTEAKPEQK